MMNLFYMQAKLLQEAWFQEAVPCARECLQPVASLSAAGGAAGPQVRRGSVSMSVEALAAGTGFRKLLLPPPHAATHGPPLPQGPGLPLEDLQVCGPREQAGGLAAGTGEHEWPTLGVLGRAMELGTAA